jgi:hypothetical protein
MSRARQHGLIEEHLQLVGMEAVLVLDEALVQNALYITKLRELGFGARLIGEQQLPPPNTNSEGDGDASAQLVLLDVEVNCWGMPRARVLLSYRART